MAIAPASLRFPSAYAQMLIDIATVYQLPVESLLARYELHLPEGWNTNPDIFIDGVQFSALLDGLSDFIEVGGVDAQEKVLEFFPLTIHGYVGLAAMTAATLQQALDIGVRYFHQVMPAFDVSYHVDGQSCVLTADPISDFGNNNALLAETVVCAIKSVLQFLDLGFEHVVVNFQHSALVMTGFESFYPGASINMGCAQNSLVFPAAALGSAVLTGNAATFKMMQGELAKREAFLANRQTLVYQVFMMIKEWIGAGRKVDVESIAASLNLSVRTFVRRLKDEGSSFKVIHDQCRLDLAAHLLSNSSKPMVVISSELGFANESSFSRYIKDKTGLSPMQHRNKQKERMRTTIKSC